MWEYDCPKFRDFDDPLSLEESPENYFDVEHSASDIFEVLEQSHPQDASVVKRHITRSMSAEAHPGSVAKPFATNGTGSISHDQHFRAAQDEDEKENLAINASQVPGKHLCRTKEKTAKRTVSAPNVALKDVKQGSHHNCLQEGSQVAPFKSLAQFVGEYQSKTPVRFHTTCTTRPERPPLEALPPHPTVPVTSVLSTKLRYHHKGLNKQDEEKLSRGSKIDLQTAVTVHSNQDGSSCAKESSSAASNKDVHTFHAWPLPNLKRSFHPEKGEVEPTVQEQFCLSSNSRHVENLKSTLAKQKDEQPRRFKAQACSVVHQPPFEVKRSGLHTTPLDMVLHSQIRAEQRRLFERNLEEAAMRKEAEAAEAERHRKMQEEKEDKEERRRRVHKARPAPQYTKKNTDSRM